MTRRRHTRWARRPEIRVASSQGMRYAGTARPADATEVRKTTVRERPRCSGRCGLSVGAGAVWSTPGEEDFVRIMTDACTLDTARGSRSGIRFISA